MNNIVLSSILLSKHGIPIDIVNVIIEYATYEDNSMNEHYKSVANTLFKDPKFMKGHLTLENCGICGEYYGQYGFERCWSCNLIYCVDCLNKCTVCYYRASEEYYFSDDIPKFCLGCWKAKKRYPKVRIIDEYGDEDRYYACQECIEYYITNKNVLVQK